MAAFGRGCRLKRSDSTTCDPEGRLTEKNPPKEAGRSLCDWKGGSELDGVV